MAILACEHCRKPISTKQARCPYCQMISTLSEDYQAKHKKPAFGLGFLAPLFHQR